MVIVNWTMCITFGIFKLFGQCAFYFVTLVRVWKAPWRTVWNECRIVLKICHSLRTMLKICSMTNWNPISAISYAHLPISLHQLWEVCRVLLLRSNSFDDWPSSIAKKVYTASTIQIMPVAGKFNELSELFVLKIPRTVKPETFSFRKIGPNSKAAWRTFYGVRGPFYGVKAPLAAWLGLFGGVTGAIWQLGGPFTLALYGVLGSGVLGLDQLWYMKRRIIIIRPTKLLKRLCYDFFFEKISNISSSRLLKKSNNFHDCIGKVG